MTEGYLGAFSLSFGVMVVTGFTCSAIVGIYVCVCLLRSECND